MFILQFFSFSSSFKSLSDLTLVSETTKALQLTHSLLDMLQIFCILSVCFRFLYCFVVFCFSNVYIYFCFSIPKVLITGSIILSAAVCQYPCRVRRSFCLWQNNLNRRVIAVYFNKVWTLTLKEYTRIYYRINICKGYEIFAKVIFEVYHYYLVILSVKYVDICL